MAYRPYGGRGGPRHARNFTFPPVDRQKLQQEAERVDARRRADFKRAMPDELALQHWSGGLTAFKHSLPVRTAPAAHAVRGPGSRTRVKRPQSTGSESCLSNLPRFRRPEKWHHRLTEARSHVEDVSASSAPLRRPATMSGPLYLQQHVCVYGTDG